MKKKEYIMPAARVTAMKYRLSLLAGSPESLTGGDYGTEGEHGEAKKNSIFDLDLTEEEEY